MKNRRLALCLAAVALVGAAWWGMRGRHSMDGPPTLTVTTACGSAQVGFWSGHWSGPSGNFTADGDSSTAPYARNHQKVVQVREGERQLTLSYPAAPSHLRVHFTPDSAARSQMLWEGQGSREVTIPLPEDFRGIYEVYEQWEDPLTTGGASRGFLVVEEGAPVGDPKLERPPELTVSHWASGPVTATRGGYSWCVWQGGEEFEMTIADSLHPLQMPDLPALEVQPGEGLDLQFAVPVSQVEVRMFSADGPAEGTGVEVQPGMTLQVPEDGCGKTYVVRAGWFLAGENWGEAEYLFQIP